MLLRFQLKLLLKKKWYRSWRFLQLKLRWLRYNELVQLSRVLSFVSWKFQRKFTSNILLKARKKNKIFKYHTLRKSKYKIWKEISICKLFENVSKKPPVESSTSSKFQHKFTSTKSAINQRPRGTYKSMKTF